MAKSTTPRRPASPPTAEDLAVVEAEAAAQKAREEAEVAAAAEKAREEAEAAAAAEKAREEAEAAAAADRSRLEASALDHLADLAGHQLTVRGPARGRYRAGLHFTREPVTLAVDDLDADQIAALLGDSELTVEID